MNNTLIILLPFLFFSASIADGISRRTACGGALTSNSDEIDYPGPGESVIPGEVCVWTVHLNSTDDFRIIFDKFDLKSSSPNYDCADTGLRIYPLTNKLPPNQIQNETFCSDVPPPFNFTLDGNILAIVLYAGNSNPGSGFTLRFNGTNTDRLNTTHLSSFSNIPSGIIGYPIGGTYPPAVAATWNVEIPSGNATVYTDLNVLSVGLQDCSNSDVCSCDALFIYEISGSGILSTRSRFCSATTDEIITQASSRFIVAFFSDQLIQPGNATGFTLQYFKSEIQPTTTQAPTTTTPTTTTTKPPTTTNRPGIDFPCGSVITTAETQLTYKEAVAYGQNERCVWTLRVEGASSYRIDIETYGVTNLRDGLSISAFNHTGDLDSASIQTTQVYSEGTYEAKGVLAILVFHTGATAPGYGFRGSITALFDDRNNLNSTNFVYTDPEAFSVSYPEIGNYQSGELSTFTYVPNSQVRYNRAEVSILDLGGSCRDNLSIFVFSEASGTGGTWLFDQRMCNADSVYLVTSRDIILFILYTDDTFEGRGFTIKFG